MNILNKSLMAVYYALEAESGFTLKYIIKPIPTNVFA